MITDGTGWPLRTGRPGAGRPPGDTTQPHDRRRVAAVGTGVSRRRSPTAPGGRPWAGRPRGHHSAGDRRRVAAVGTGVSRRRSPTAPGGRPGAGRPGAGRGLAGPGDTAQPRDRRRVVAVGTGVSRRRSPTVPGGWLRTGRPGAGRRLAGHGDTAQPVIVAELWRSGPGFLGDDHRRSPVAGRGLAVGWPWAGRPGAGRPGAGRPRGHRSAGDRRRVAAVGTGVTRR